MTREVFEIQIQCWVSLVKCVSLIVKMEANYSAIDLNNSTFYPREATILAAVCACVFSVVGVVGECIKLCY